MRLLLAFLLLLPLRLLAAVGDITGAEVETNGWVIKLYISGLNTNGNFFNGFGVNNTLTATNALTLTLDSMGFNDAGEGIIKRRTVYGTKLLRMPYPSQLTNDVATDGDGCIPRIALSEYVYASDSNLTLTVLAGGYAVTNGDGTNCTLTSALATTNGSVQPYPSVIGNWSWRGFRVIDEEYMTLRAVAFHKFAEQGRPIRAAMFWVTDSGGDSFTNWTTQMVIDKTMGDANPVPEYIARFATNTLASGFVVCNVRFYPWIGSAALDSSTTGYLEPAGYLCPLTNAVNYPRVRAIVSNIGSDTGSFALNEAGWATNQSPSNFLTIGKAMVAVYATNNSSYSRAGWGGAIIYLMNGDYGWFGSTADLANGPAVELVVMPYPGQTSIAITNYAGGDRMAKQDQDIYRIKDVNIGGTAAIGLWYRQAWMDRCTVTNNSSSVLLDGNGTTASTVAYTQCHITNSPGAIGAPSSDNTPSLLRGNYYGTNVGSAPKFFTALGNVRYHPGPPSSFAWTYDADAQNAPRNFPAILAYNSAFNVNAVGLSIPTAYSITNGAAIIENVFESGTGGTQLGNMGADSATIHMTNVLVWYNVFAGGRAHRAYNWTGTAPSYSIDTSWIGNVYDWTPHKYDSINPENGARNGCWSVTYGVSCKANYLGFVTNIASEFYPSMFAGLYTFETSANQNQSVQRYTTRGGYIGSTTNAPGGDYRLFSDSPLHLGLGYSGWILPYDIEGLNRGMTDPPGSYSSGNVRKGIMF